MGRRMCVTGIITGSDCFLPNMNNYNPYRRTGFPSLLLGPKWKRSLRLLDLILFLVIDVLFFPAVLPLRPVITLASDEQSAGEQNAKD